MPNRTLLRFALGASLLGCGSAAAQVSFDQHALDQLNKPAQQAAPGSTPSDTPAAKAPPQRPPARPAPSPPRTRPQPSTAPATKPPPAKPPTPAHPPDARHAPLPTAPPANPNLPPPIVVPARPSPPPSPVPVVPTAEGSATPIPGGERITFGPGVADLNAATDAALRALVHGAPPSNPFAPSTFTVTSYAAGSAEDPSTPRRVALSRALAVRGVLITEGIASIRIYVKALGASGPLFADGPPDRVDVIVTTPDAPKAAAPPAAPAAPTPPPPPRAK